MCNKQFVIMSNEYPLNFFFIREKSIIFVEFIHSKTKTEEVSEKIRQRDIKSKYFIFEKLRNSSKISSYGNNKRINDRGHCR